MNAFVKNALSIIVVIAVTPAASDENARAIVKAAIDHWRGTSSITVMTMTIHRPDWERSMSMRGWTLGSKDTLVRVIEPKKDAGNGTLTNDNKMWSYSPKVNRVIRIPSSMMNQSWMGSDFSNKDVSRSDDIVDQYDHKLLATEQHDGKKLYVIESVPKEDAAVVWGKEIVKVRDDHVMTEHEYYDQDMKLVKRLHTIKVEEMGGRTIASQQRMTNKEKPNQWTEVLINSAEYDVSIPKSTFTLSNLRNPRQ